MISFGLVSQSNRFTSACAEKMAIPAFFLQSGAVHLRVCGENIKYLLIMLCAAGSPPRVRRKLKLTVRRACCARFTSACAEKIRGASYRARNRAVHLRVCGENQNRAVEKFLSFGSPPRVRRKYLNFLLPALRSRFTSACAEKMLIAPANVLVQRRPRFTSACAEKMPQCAQKVREFSVHLRVCGENLIAPANLRAVARFTSACAEKMI